MPFRGSRVLLFPFAFFVPFRGSRVLLFEPPKLLNFKSIFSWLGFQALAMVVMLSGMSPQESALHNDWDQRAATLALSLVSGVGPSIRDRLLEQFGSPSAVLAASAEQLISVGGMGVKMAHAVAATTIDAAEEELHHCHAHQINVLIPSDGAFPSNLAHIDSPPQVLFCLGQLLPHDELAVAIVGTRHATAYGKRIAHKLASALAQSGLTIVSGLARGIDAAAHCGALDAGGRTIAVLPGGLMNLYPPEHKELAFDISQSGSLVTEFPSRWPVQRGAFPRRNRLITGLSLGVIVVEAGERSGALVSASHAAAQGREVFAVPGPVDSRMSVGCHALLRDGAMLVETVDDVFEALGPLAQTAARATGEDVRHPAELKLNQQEKQVLCCIETQPTNIDQIVAESKIPVNRVLATISALEVRHIVRRVGGNQVMRT